MPVGVGETWHQMLVKCVLVVTGAEDRESCETEQLCSGMDAGIEGGIHAFRILWKNNA